MSLKVVPANQEWTTPTIVVIWWVDGEIEERAFSTRNEATAFITSIPYMQVYFPESEFTDIIKAKLRPALVSIN